MPVNPQTFPLWGGSAASTPKAAVVYNTVGMVTKVIELRCVGFTGTLDILASVDGAAYDSVSYFREDTNTWFYGSSLALAAVTGTIRLWMSFPYAGVSIGLSAASAGTIAGTFYGIDSAMSIATLYGVNTVVNSTSISNGGGSLSMLGTGDANLTKSLFIAGTDPWADVKASPYGAVGDGIADDTAAIQLAIAAVNAVGGGRVFFPAGTFLTTASLTIPGNNIELVGEGMDVSVIKYTGSAQAIKTSSNASVRSNFQMADITVDTRSAGASHVAVELDNFNQPIFRNVRLNGTGASGTGLQLIGSGTKSTYLGQFFNLYVTADVYCVLLNDRCNGHRFFGGQFDGTGTAIGILPVTLTCDTALFDGVAVQTTGATCVQLGGAGATASDNEFIACRFEPSASNFNIAAGSLRNAIIGGSFANVTIVDGAVATNATVIIVPKLNTFIWGGQSTTAKASILLTSANAGMSFGNDAVANLYRRTASVLKTDAEFESAGAIVAFQGDATNSTRLGGRTLAPSGTGPQNMFVDALGTGILVLQSNATGAVQISGPSITFPADGSAAQAVVPGTINGLKIGTATGQKLGFWNAVPVVQQVLATGALMTVDDVITFLQLIGLCKQS